MNATQSQSYFSANEKREIFNNHYTTVCVEYGICQEICDIYVTDSVLKLH